MLKLALISRVFFMHLVDAELMTISGQHYYANSCPCGLSKVDFDKEFRKYSLRLKKTKILEKLRFKRENLEVNYTVTLEKLPQKTDKIVADFDINLEDYLNYEDIKDLFDPDPIIVENDFNFQLHKAAEVDQKIDKKTEAPWLVKVGPFCNGVFINKGFILSSFDCVKKMDIKELLIVRPFDDSCKSPIKVKNIQKFEDVAILEIHQKDASLKNFPICLPISPQKFLPYGRIFNLPNSCQVQDAFIKFTSPSPNCPAKRVCGWSPDSFLCDWMSRGPILTFSDLGQSELIGIGSESECPRKKFTFRAISNDTLNWIIRHIQQGECFHE